VLLESLYRLFDISNSAVLLINKVFTCYMPNFLFGTVVSVYANSRD